MKYWHNGSLRVAHINEQDVAHLDAGDFTFAILFPQTGKGTDDNEAVLQPGIYLK